MNVKALFVSYQLSKVHLNVNVGEGGRGTGGGLVGSRKGKRGEGTEEEERGRDRKEMVGR